MAEKRKLRILFISNVNSAHARRWARFMTKLGHTIVFLSVQPGTLDDIEVIYRDPGDHGPKWLKYLSHTQFILYERQLIATGGFDIVHVHFLRADMIGWVAMSHPRAIISVWGSDVRLPEDGGDPTRIGIKRKAIQRAALITVTNGFLEDQVRKLHPKVKRVEIVPFGVDNIFLNKGKRTIIDEIRIHFCFAKPRLLQLYGLDLLIKAFSRVVRRYPRSKLSIVGRGEPKYLKELHSLVEKAGIKKQVTFTGYLSTDELSAIFQRSDILVQPSRWESFGVVLLEAMAVDLPVIATNVGGVSELVINEVTGLLVPPDDLDALTESMLKLAGDKGLRQRLAQNGRSMASYVYNFDMHGERMETLYYELTDGKSNSKRKNG
ncbi:MAG: glycosyltransferase family 4 protein [Candidatus Electryoneaceae bacterium]|nr:glycosyltransferase family 4 protein [Candidatus Electryoneaceae bacterium]